jgi:hypothetical protein
MSTSPYLKFLEAVLSLHAKSSDKSVGVSPARGPWSIYLNFLAFPPPRTISSNGLLEYKVLRIDIADSGEEQPSGIWTDSPFGHGDLGGPSGLI